MSQVIVTDDDLNAKRAKAAKQEHQISVEGDFAAWRRSDVVGFDPVKTAIGFAVLPIVAFWGFILACVTFAFGLAAGIFRLLGGMIGTKFSKRLNGKK